MPTPSTDAATLVARRRATVLAPLAARPRCSRVDARTAATALGLSERQVFHLIRRLRTAGGDPAALRPARSNGGQGKPRLGEAAELAIREIIAEHSSSKGGTAGIVALIRDRCRARNLPPPSMSTVRRRLDKSLATNSDVPGAIGLDRSEALAATLHLLRVAQLNRQLAALEARAIAADAALDRLSMAMLVLDDAAQVVHLNAAAERIVTAGDGLTIVQNGLVAARSDESQALRQLIAEALRVSRNITASPGVMMRVGRPSGRMPYEVLVAPLSCNTLSFAFTEPLASVFVRDPEAQVTAPMDRLRRLYALTGAEARLMQALVAGDTLDIVADRFGVGKETLRSQLKSVFSKTGTSSQIELLRLGLRGLAALEE